jgi:hypothetical protein
LKYLAGFKALAHRSVNPPVDTPEKRLGVGSAEDLRPRTTPYKIQSATPTLKVVVNPYDSKLFPQKQGLMTEAEFPTTGYYGEPGGVGY